MNNLELRKFVAPEFVFGVGARNLTGQYVRNCGARKALVVTDAGVMVTNPRHPNLRNIELIYEEVL